MRGRVVVEGVLFVDRVCDGGTKSVHVQAVSPRPVRESLKAWQTRFDGSRGETKCSSSRW